MAEFQAEVPDPLGDQLPAFLPVSAVTTPTVGIKLAVFVAESWLEGPAMQVQLHHIAGGEAVLRQAGKEEFVDHTLACESHPTLCFARWMSGNHDATAHAIWSHGHVGAIVEAARDLAFWATLLSIRGQVESSLDEGVIQHGVVLAPRHKRVACQI
jgi:hypothetical protein